MNKKILDILDSLKTLKKELINETKSKFLSIQTYKCTLNNGKTITREKLVKNGKDGSAAIIFPITEDGKVLLAAEPRVFTKETVDIGLPAGYIEENEDASVAAKRELLEETGYEADTLIPLGAFYQDQGCSGAYNHYFLALNCRKVCDQHLDKDEFIEYILVDIDLLDELIDNNIINGLNSAYAIEKGKRYLKEM